MRLVLIGSEPLFGVGLAHSLSARSLDHRLCAYTIVNELAQAQLPELGAVDAVEVEGSPLNMRALSPNWVRRVIAASAVSALVGCAGGSSNPVFNSSVKSAHIFAPGEVNSLGLPERFSNATGEVRYCASGMVELIQSRKKEALAVIASACGGEDKYGLIDEIQADATGTFMGVDVKCVGNAGRAIFFTCKSGKPRSADLDKQPSKSK